MAISRDIRLFYFHFQNYFTRNNRVLFFSFLLSFGNNFEIVIVENQENGFTT